MKVSISNDLQQNSSVQGAGGGQQSQWSRGEGVSEKSETAKRLFPATTSEGRQERNQWQLEGASGLSMAELCLSKHSHVEVLAPSTSECDSI